MSRKKKRIMIPTITTRRIWWADRTDEKGRNIYRLVSEEKSETVRLVKAAEHKAGKEAK